MSLSHDSNPHIPMNAQPIAQPQMQFQQQQFQQQPAAASNSLLPDNNRYFEERAAIPANHQLSEEERWRLQEEKWAKDEQARYGLPSSVNAAMGSSEAEMREPFPSPMSNNTSLRTHPSAFAANNNFNGIPDDSAPLDAERFGKLRTYYDRSGQPMQQQMSNPNSNDAMMRAEQFNQQQTIPNADVMRAENLNAIPKMAPSISNSAVSVNASTRSLVNEDGIAPYSNKDTTIASTLRANKNYDDRIIAEHDVIMAAEGERYNAIAAATGHQARIDDSADMKAEPGLVSPTAYLDDAQIMEEKAKQAELERRIAERNSQYADRVKDQEFQEEHAKELGIIPGAGAAAVATVPLKQGEFINSADNDQQQQQHWDENAPSDNFVTMGKTRNSKLNAAGRTPAAQRAHDLQVRQSAGLPEETEEMRIKREKSPKETLNAVKAALVAGHPKIEDAIPLGAQLYTGNPPKSIQPILDDTPDLWFDQYRRDTAERRSKKETLRRVDLNRKEKETQGSVTTRIAAVFDDTKASIKRSKQEHDLKAEDRKMTNFNQKAKERMSKYFRVHGNERFVCAFDCQALHNHQPISGHAILTEQTLCFVGKGQEDFEVLDNKANTADPHAPVSTVHRRENILVKEIIPLGNIASITMGTVVKNNGKVFIMDAADDLIVADAIQLFCKDGRVVQLRSFSHPCVTQKGKSYDGRIVPSIHRFLNFLDHNWRANGSFIPQNNTNANNNIRE